MSRKQVVILGGGTGVTMTANRLRRRFDSAEAEIHVVDRDDSHVYQPGLLFVPFGLAGRYYLGAATALGAAFVALSLRGLRAGGRFDVNRWAKQVFAFSVVYLPALLIALLVARA